MPKGSRTSFAKADVEDAKRGAPAVDLGSFAERRGLESLGSVVAFAGILPDYPDYIFNTSRGVLDGDRFGLVEHGLYEISLDDDGDLSMPGSYDRTATRTRFSLGRLIGIQGDPRGAAWFPARKKAETPVGGTLHEPTDMYAEVVDGSVWCWSRLRSFRKLESRLLGDRAVRTVTELGLVDA